MRPSLYQKIFIWFALNLVLPGLVLVMACGWFLFGSTDGLFSPFIFRKNIHTIVRLVAVNLQYLPMQQWDSVLRDSSREHGLDFHFLSLDTPGRQPVDSAIPVQVRRAAARVPRPPFSLCAEPLPEDQFASPPSDTPSVEMEAGIPPPQRAIFMRAGEPPRYWFGRTIFVADEDKNLHYVLLAAASSSISGNGQFFNIEGLLWVLVVVIGFSVLWWWPFVRHITHPLKTMTETAERIAAGNYAPLPGEGADVKGIARPDRNDEIGRLAQAVKTMAEQVQRQMHGQRRFIRHIAHELGSPLARIKLGLAVLDSRLDGDARDRINQVSLEVEQLSLLVEDVLTFLRAEAAPPPSEPTSVPLLPLLRDVVEREAQGKDVQIVAYTEVEAWADADCLRRAVANVLRNAVRYTGKDGHVVLEIRREDSHVILEVSDNGPGVEEQELGHLMEPFYRGSSAAAHPGGCGLGLSIVKHCIEACGGSVTCRNLEPSGFAVRMRFLSPQG